MILKGDFAQSCLNVQKTPVKGYMYVPEVHSYGSIRLFFSEVWKGERTQKINHHLPLAI